MVLPNGNARDQQRSQVIEINNAVQLSAIVVQFGWRKDNGFISKQKAVTHRFYEKHPCMLLMWKCRSFLKVNIFMQWNAVQHQRGHRSATIISFLEREGGSHDCLRSELNSSSSFSWTHIKLKDWRLLSKLVLFTFFLHFDWSHCRILITHVNLDLTCPCPLPPQIQTIQIPISKNFAFPCFMCKFVWQSYSKQVAISTFDIHCSHSLISPHEFFFHLFLKILHSGGEKPHKKEKMTSRCSTRPRRTTLEQG
jgi:hypothetical protein